MERHASDSLEQQQAEAFMLKSLAEKLHLSFNKEIKLAIYTGAQPDAIDPSNKVIVEVYAHVGKLKGAQLHKVKGDILKLLFVEEKLGEKWRKILCFADEAAASYARGESWVAEAVRTFGVEVWVVELSEEQLNQITLA